MCYASMRFVFYLDKRGAREGERGGGQGGHALTPEQKQDLPRK